MATPHIFDFLWIFYMHLYFMLIYLIWYSKRLYKIIVFMWNENLITHLCNLKLEEVTVIPQAVHLDNIFEVGNESDFGYANAHMWTWFWKRFVHNTFWMMVPFKGWYGQISFSLSHVIYYKLCHTVSYVSSYFVSQYCITG